MEVFTPKSTRRSTRLRVEIPISITSLDRARPFAEKCVALVVSSQGCGFRSSRAFALETPIMIGDLPNGGSVTARVASCLPLGNDGKSFLIGAALYNHGNVWGIANPPADWNTEGKDAPPAARVGAAAGSSSAQQSGPSKAPASATASVQPASNKKSWPYNLFESGADSHSHRK